MIALALLATTAFCRIATPTTLDYAPNMLSPCLRPPTAEQYLAAGWLHNRVQSATNATGMVAYLDRYEARGDGVEAVWRYEPIPYVPRRIYKYDLSTACIEYGEITNLITLVSADVGTKWMWDAAEILVENDPWFVAATNTIISEGIIEEAKVRAIIERAYELGQTANAASEAK